LAGQRRHPAADVNNADSIAETQTLKIARRSGEGFVADEKMHMGELRKGQVENLEVY
jgi:hypothetical protein